MILRRRNIQSSSSPSSSSIMMFTSSLVLLLLLIVVVLVDHVTDAVHQVPTKKAIPPLMEPPPMLPEVTDKVWMTIAINGKEVGTIEFGLFGTNSPKAVANFVALSKCDAKQVVGKLSNKPLCYKNSTIHRVIPNFAFQGGDVTHGDGTGGESIYGGKFVADQHELVKFTRKRLLANAGGGYGSANDMSTNTFGSQFFVTTAKAQWLTGKYTAFGLVLQDDDDVITAMEQVGTYGGKPKATIQIIDVGIGKVTENDKKPHY